MKLYDLIDGLEMTVVHGSAHANVTELTDDSRQVTRGSLFLARTGPKDHGTKFIQDALAKGASVVITSAHPTPVLMELGGDVTWVVGDNLNQALAGELAERFFGRPSRKLKLIGVTGTNGKTTTAYLIQHLLKCAGLPCGLIGTVITDDGKDRRASDLTTPGAIEFSRLLKAMVDNGCRAAAAEVSSHALHQGRVAALHFHVGVFTNLTGDHLDYHGTMDDYASAKAILFHRMGAEDWAVINAEDPYSTIMTRSCGGHVANCSISNPEPKTAQARATVLELGARHSLVRFEGPWGSREVKLPLVGRHNVMNALQAITAANCVTAISRVLRDGIEKCPSVPGRLERVTVEAPGRSTEAAAQVLPTVLVDYAHTHDALENVLLALRPLTKGKLITMFGCGGDRDKTKRPKMAAVACKLADQIIITSDNPRTEDALAILRDILAGMTPGFATLDLRYRPRELADLSAAELATKVIIEPDRAKAIALTIASAGVDDVVILAGKGHEDYQIIGVTKRHFDDREHAAEALRKRLAQTPMAMAS